MDIYTQKQGERMEYKSDYMIEISSKKIIKKNITNTYLRRILVELPTILFSVGILLASFIGYRFWQRTDKTFTTKIVSASVNATGIVIFGLIYRKIAIMLVNWENHRYEEEWENSLITKNFAFQFVNAYIALFAIAFEPLENVMENRFNKMAVTLAIILIVKQISMNVVEVTLTWLIVTRK